MPSQARKQFRSSLGLPEVTRREREDFLELASEAFQLDIPDIAMVWLNLAKMSPRDATPYEIGGEA